MSIDISEPEEFKEFVKEKDLSNKNTFYKINIYDLELKLDSKNLENIVFNLHNSTLTINNCEVVNLTVKGSSPENCKVDITNSTLYNLDVSFIGKFIMNKCKFISEEENEEEFSSVFVNINSCMNIKIKNSNLIYNNMSESANFNNCSYTEIENSEVGGDRRGVKLFDCNTFKMKNSDIINSELGLSCDNLKTLELEDCSFKNVNTCIKYNECENIIVEDCEGLIVELI